MIGGMINLYPEILFSLDIEFVEILDIAPVKMKKII
jgi:hypothetical protein